MYVLLTAGTASADERVGLVAQASIAPRLAAFPRLVLCEPQAARINLTLAAAATRAGVAAEDCRLQSEGSPADPRTLGWTRRIAIAMRGPRYPALVAEDCLYCGGLYPNAYIIAPNTGAGAFQGLNWLIPQCRPLHRPRRSYPPKP